MIVTLTFAQSEADIIEYFVRANLQLADHMVIMLNPSEDGTEAILDALVAEGLPVTVWKMPINNHNQQQHVTTILNRIRDQLDPDIIFPIDADEIILCSGKEQLHSAIELLPDGTVPALPWVTFIPSRGQEEAGFFQPESWSQRIAVEPLQYNKVAIPVSFLCGQYVTIGAGSHSVVLQDNTTAPDMVLPDLFLAHLPARTVRQITAKVYSGIVAKGIALGPGWRGRSSTHREKIIEYLGRAQKPDVVEIACRYASKEWSADVASDVVIDGRLPKLVLKYCALERKLPIERHLLLRSMSNIFPQPDVTEDIRQRQKQRRRAAISSGNAPPVPLSLDFPPLDYMMTRFTPQSVLQVGCGTGAELSLMQARGAGVFGVDRQPWSDAHFIASDLYLLHDLESGMPGLPQIADMSICIGALENLPESAALQMIDGLAAASRNAIIFAAARPGQSGKFLTVKPPNFWLARFRQAGWDVDGDATFSVRFLATLLPLRRNLFVLRPAAEVAPLSDELVRMLDEQSVHADRQFWPEREATVIGYPGQRAGWTLTGKRLPPMSFDRELTQGKKSAAQGSRKAASWGAGFFIRIRSAGRRIWGKIIPNR